MSEVAERRPKKRRLHYRQHPEDDVKAAIRMAIMPDSIFADWLLERATEDVDGVNEYGRGISEGRRRMCKELLSYALEEEVKVVNARD